MVMYARSDILRLSLPTESGCGVPHTRPTKGDGSPFPTWGIDCAACEAHLGGDPRWSKSRFKIPLTPDEEQEAKDLADQSRLVEERIRLELQRQTVTAVLSQQGGQVDEHPEDVAITTSNDEDPGASGGIAGPTGAPKSSAADYNALSKPELMDLARDRGLTVGGTKDALVSRLVSYDNDGGTA